MTTFTREEQRLLILVGACGLVASAVLLCLPGYPALVPLTRLPTTPSAPTTPPRSADHHGATTSATAATSLRRVDPNFASYEELTSIPGVGPVLARKILAHREQNLLFSAEDMLRVPGIGSRTWQRLAPHFVFGTATETAEPR